MKRFFFLTLIMVSCGAEKTLDEPEDSIQEEVVEIEDRSSEILDSLTRTVLDTIGLVDIQLVNDRIFVDLRYASTNNFMGVQLYDTLRQLFLQKEVAERLSNCQDLLDSLNPGYHLLVYDGVRPLQVQQEMWNALDSIPTLNRGKFVSNPKFGSVHNFGAAVDLTISDSLGIPLDMGAGYDDFRKIAFPSQEAHFLETGELTTAQWKNRKLLRRIMRSQKFNNIPSEWWHFNAYSRVTASHKYQLLRSESGEAIWFKIAPKIVDNSDSLINPE